LRIAARDGHSNDPRDQRQGVERVDDEYRTPGHRVLGQRPENLRSVDRAGIDQYMGKEGQVNQYKPAFAMPCVYRMDFLDQPDHQRRQQGQHDHRVAE